MPGWETGTKGRSFVLSGHWRTEGWLKGRKSPSPPTGEGCHDGVPTLRVGAGDASCPRRQERGSPGGMPSRSAESTEPQPQVSLFPRPVGTSPSQCYAAGQGRATHLSLSVCVSTPALQHSCRDPHLSRRGELPGPLMLHSPTWGLRKAEESRPALTPQPGLGPVTPAKAARPAVPDESCSLPRGTSSGGAGVSPSIHHPQSSHPDHQTPAGCGRGSR